MIDTKFSWDLFNKMPIIGIVRNVTFDDIMHILPIYLQAGLTSIEITMNTDGAAEIIEYIRLKYPETLNVGAGTVRTKKELKKALEAGAHFIVTPVVKKKIITSCVKEGVPIFPGAFSPTEIFEAWELGASMVKVFPAKALGPGYIKDVKAPLDDVKLLPTGGIDLENIEAFKKAGAEGFGVGSPLFQKDLIKEKNWAGLKEHFQKFVEKVREA